MELPLRTPGARRPPVWLAMLLAPAGVDALLVFGTVALAALLGRDPNLETTFLLVPIPMARVLLGLADAYALTGAGRACAVMSGIVASIGWWIAGLLIAASIAGAWR